MDLDSAMDSLRMLAWHAFSPLLFGTRHLKGLMLLGKHKSSMVPENQAMEYSSIDMLFPHLSYLSVIY